MTEPLKFATAEAIFEGRLRGNQLMISGLRIGPGEARLLWNSPTMEQVTWLDLDDNQIGDEGVAELAQCVRLANVQYLNLNKNEITDEGLKSLAQSTCLPKLKRLHMKGNDVKGEGILALFNSPGLENLQNFQLHEGWSCRKREGWRYNPQF